MKMFTGCVRYMLAFWVALAFGLSAAVASDKASERAEVRNDVKEVLDQLYREVPSARKAVQSAKGYAVFSNFGMKIFLAGGGSGHGIAYDRTTGKETFMKMMEIQAGLGMGIKKFGLVFIFNNRIALNKFINSGWDASTQSTAAAKMKDQGVSLQGAVDVAPGVWVYQITDTGLALDLTIKGTRYYPDDDLN